MNRTGLFDFYSVIFLIKHTLKDVVLAGTSKKNCGLPIRLNLFLLMSSVFELLRYQKISTFRVLRI